MTAVESIEWQGERLQLLADRAIHWPAGRTLFVADPHFGKTDAFRTVGIAVPGDAAAENCRRLTRLIDSTRCERLVILGDFLHSSWGRSEGLRNTLNDWRRRHDRLDVILVRGNHDRQAGDPWPELRVQCEREPWPLGAWTCRHEPDAKAKKAVLAGHLHPAISFAGSRAACFWVGARQLILPAFGEFTGTHLVKPELDDRIFVTDGRDLIEVPIG